MASYIDSNLAAGEKVLYRTRKSKWTFSGDIIIGALLLPAFGAGLLVWLFGYLRYISTEMAITSHRVIAKSGFISRRTVELKLAKVKSIQVDQSLFGRMLNYGTLIVSGAGNPQAPITGIANPLAFRKAYQEATE